MHINQGVPVNTGGSLTTWNYHFDTGRLASKRDHEDKGADYTYTAAGRPETRTWERGVVTTYGYDDGGRLETITYFDNSPSVTIELDALGRRKSVTNFLATSTFIYKSDTINLESETVTYNHGFTRQIIHGPLDVGGRPIGYVISTTASPPVLEKHVEHRYHETEGRLHQIESPAGTFTYGYEDDSLHLLANVAGLVHTVANTWENSRNVLETKTNAVTIGQDPEIPSSFHYTVNAIGQRTTLCSFLVPAGTLDPAPCGGQEHLSVLLPQNPLVNGFAKPKDRAGERQNPESVPRGCRA